MSTIQEQAGNLLQFRESQILCHTDIVIVRETTTGKCGQASCLFLRCNNMEYAVSCAHILKPGSEYFTGAKRLNTDRIPEGVYNEVAPLKLVNESRSDDLAVFTHDGLKVSRIPKEHYTVEHSPVDYEAMIKNIGTLSFILGAPGAFTQGIQYPDGLVYVEADLYSAYGPIVSVDENRIIADFAERELVSINERSERLKDFVPTGGARDLGGMSGSGLWVYATNRFHLAGVLRGRETGSDPMNSHRIEFTPIWKLRALLNHRAPA
jgi:hypothetical protein